MRKLILFLATSTFFMVVPVISIEREFVLSVEKQFQLTFPAYSSYYQSIPVNPNVYETVKTFKDSQLTQFSGEIQPNQKWTIVDMGINANLQPVYQLEDGNFLLASSTAIFEDRIQTSDVVQKTVWFKKGAKVMTSPIGNQAQQVADSPDAYSKVMISELVTTPRGQFAKIEQGWVSVDDLSVQDNRMEKVQGILNEKYHQEDVSIYVYQLDTGITAGINQDKVMHSASTAKLPILYFTQLQLDSGKIRLSDRYHYSEAVNAFDGAYLPEGSGILPKQANETDYSLQELIQLTAKESDNVASNMLSYYVTNQFDDHFYEVMNTVTQTSWDMSHKNGTAKQAGLVMKALYDLNSKGFVLDALSTTAFDEERISKHIDVRVAHKIGDAYDFRHDVAVIYAESPYVLSIFTDHKNYNDISQISDDIYAVLKS